jgi:hypothetical protein
MLPAMSIPVSWSATAWNPVPESENRIHGDDVARRYGFRGGLVPGVVVSAYLLHPAASAWGRAFAERGRAHCVVRSPVYDGEPFRVEVSDASAHGYHAVLVDERGERCAKASASLPEHVPEPPKRRHDPVQSRGDARPDATPEVMEQLRETGLRALRSRWSEEAEITRYLRDPAQQAPVYRDTGIAHPGFVLGTTNWLLGQNVKMSAWLHLETESQHFRAIEPGAELVVEAEIADLFEKKGHRFVDVDLELYELGDDAAVATVGLRAIYQLRPAEVDATAVR